MSVFSEEVIARDIEEFEKQKHLLNTPVQVNARILLVEFIFIFHDWLNDLYVHYVLDCWRISLISGIFKNSKK